jgi:hypothetical protein
MRWKVLAAVQPIYHLLAVLPASGEALTVSFSPP